VLEVALDEEGDVEDIELVARAELEDELDAVADKPVVLELVMVD
jgi:hypothetical protein